jgi:hypothetical protein
VAEKQENSEQEETGCEQRDNKGRFLPAGGRWKPGESGNPQGRPKRRPYASILAEIGRKKCSEVKWARDFAIKLELDPEKVTVDDILGHADMLNRMKGRVGYLVEANARSEGRAPDQVETEPVDDYVARLRDAVKAADISVGGEDDAK